MTAAADISGDDYLKVLICSANGKNDAIDYISNVVFRSILLLS